MIYYYQNQIQGPNYLSNLTTLRYLLIRDFETFLSQLRILPKNKTIPERRHRLLLNAEAFGVGIICVRFLHIGV
jgi:hypothetical protein